MAGDLLPPGRRRMAIVLRWTSLPLALFVAVAPLWSLRTEAQRTAQMIRTDATVVSARLVDASRAGSEWDVEARYPARGTTVERSVEVWTFADLQPGSTVVLLVDPATGDAIDDHRVMGWIMAGFGLLLAAFFVLAAFRGTGILLRRDRAARGSGTH